MGKSTKDKRDIYYRLAKEQGLRARSAFKLLQINSEFNILNDNVKRVVDLCAAPGSWSQVLSRTLYKTDPVDDQVKIVAVDLQTMAPLPGVVQIKGDITKRSTIEEILDCFKQSDNQINKADLVICDGAPDVTGLHDIDEFIQGNLVLAALNICLHVLADNGNFVSKIFRTKNIDLLYQQLKLFFDDVVIAKPRSSRNSSVESFIVCRQFHLPNNFIPNIDEPFIYTYERTLNTKEKSSFIIPFIACGSLDGFDSDKTYPLEQEQSYLEPVQPPIHPAYEEIIMNARSQTFEFAVEGRQIDEVVSCMFHTILFHRCVGKYHTKGEDSYSVGTLGYTDVDCDYLDFTYLQVTSQELQRTVAEKINQFHDKLRSSESNRSGQITLEFYQKKKSRWMFKPEEIPWEIWTIKIEQMQLSSENERQFMREKLSDTLTERIFQITEIINKPDYVPKPIHLSELDLVFDTSYTDIQPYLFKIHFSDTPTIVNHVKTMIKEAFNTSL